MSIDASIALQGKLPQFDNPLTQYAQVAAIQNAQSTNRLADLTYAEKQREVGSDNALAGLLAGGKTGDDVVTGLAAQGYGKNALAYGKTMQEQAKAKAELGKTTAETGKINQESATHQFEIAGQLAGAWANDPTITADKIRSGLAAAAHSKIISPEIYQAKIAELDSTGQDPASLNRWALGTQQQVMKAADQMKYRMPDANTVAINANKVLTTSMTNRTSLATNGATVAATIRGQDLTDARKSEELQGAESAFSPEAISNAASRYNIDGTLPPMGMGKSGSLGRAAILNEAAKQAGTSGLSGDDQRIQQIGNKANTAALAKIQQSQTMVGAFEKNFNKNADISLEYSDKVDRTGVPIINRWLNAGKRSVAGDPDLAAFDTSVKAVSNEYAKIISGSMGNTATAEGEIKKIEGLLNAAQTPEQFKSVINLMKRETANRMQGFEEEKAALRASMKSGSKSGDAPPEFKPGTPENKEMLKKAEQVGALRPPPVPFDIQALLKKHGGK